MNLYYSDDHVQLYLGDCLKIPNWMDADILVCDPPYGIKWKSGGYNGAHKHAGIANDNGVEVRDKVLELWGDKPAIVFGDFRYPVTTALQVLVYAKSSDAGLVGSTTGFRRDVEGIYLNGKWPKRVCEKSSIIRTVTKSSPAIQSSYGHPHAKPVDVLEVLISMCPPGIIADPFAGSGSTLVAARNLGRNAIGVELEEVYARRAASRLSEQPLFSGEVT